MRIHMHIEQQSVTEVTPVLYVNGMQLKLTERELDDLMADIMFVRGALAVSKRHVLKAYEEIRNA